MFEFKFPDVGEGVHEGKVLKLKVKPGENVTEGDILAVVETDKVVAEIPSSKTGKLIKFGIEVGQIIEVGQTLAFLEDKNSTSTTEKKEKVIEVKEDTAGVVGQLESAGNIIMPASKEGTLDKSSNEANSLTDRISKILATPLARKLAFKYEIDLTSIIGTGPAGRITKNDILKIKETPTPKSKPPILTSLENASGAKVEEELSMVRKTIAKAMEESHMIPTASFHEEVVIGKIKNLRETLNATEGQTEKLSLQSIFIKTISNALEKYPSFNGTYNKDKMTFTRNSQHNIGLAIDTKKGLLVPVIKNVDMKSIFEINKDMLSVVDKAKNENISLTDLRDGTISISNYGPFGGLYGNPMISPPQVGIIGLGRMHEKAIVLKGLVKTAWVLPISFTFDHRVNDGALAGKFISYIKELLENPEKMLFSMK